MSEKDPLSTDYALEGAFQGLIQYLLRCGKSLQNLMCHNDLRDDKDHKNGVKCDKC